MRQLFRMLVVVLLILALAVPCHPATVLLNKVGVSPSHWSGLSSDSKPTGSYGSTFYEEDTGVPYVYGSSGWALDKRRSQGSASNSLHYLTSQAESGLANAVNLGALGSGILKQSVIGGTASFSIASAGSDYLAPSGSGASLTGITASQVGAAANGLHFFTSTAEASLANAVNLGALSTGLLKLTVAGGVATPSIAAAGSDYLAPNGSGASLTEVLNVAVLHAAVSKATPIDADEIGFYDSITGTLQKLTWANAKATLKTYFDTLYAVFNGDYVVGYSSGCSTLSAAVATLNAAGTNCTLVIPSGNYSITSDLTFNSNICAKPVKGAIFKPTTVAAPDTATNADSTARTGTITLTETTIKTQAVATNTNIDVNSTTGFAAGSPIGIILDNAAVHRTFVVSVTDADTFVIADAIPTGRTANVNARVYNLEITGVGTLFTTASEGIRSGVYIVVGADRIKVKRVDSALKLELWTAPAAAWAATAFAISTNTVTSTAHLCRVGDVVQINGETHIVASVPTADTLTTVQHPASAYTDVAWTRGVRVDLIGGVIVGNYQWIDPTTGGTVQVKRGSVNAINPMWYGAVADGSNDTATCTANTLAFNRAWFGFIVDIENTYPNHGGIVEVPAGKFYVNDTIYLYNSGTLFGQGYSDQGFSSGSTIIMKTNTNKNLIECGQESVGYTTIRNLALVMYSGTLRVAAIQKDVFNDITVKDCHIYNSGGWGIVLRGAKAKVYDNWIFADSGIWIATDSFCRGNEVAFGSASTPWSFGIMVDGGGSTIMENICFSDGGTLNCCGLYLHTGDGHRVIGNRFDNNDYGIRVYQGSGLVQGNYLNANRISAVGFLSTGTGPASTNGAITGGNGIPRFSYNYIYGGNSGSYPNANGFTFGTGFSLVASDITSGYINDTSFASVPAYELSTAVSLNAGLEIKGTKGIDSLWRFAWDPASLNAGANGNSGAHYELAAAGDLILTACPVDQKECIDWSYVVNATNNITRLYNGTVDAQDVANGSWKVTVIPKKYARASIVNDFANVAAGAQSAPLDITVPGAAIGDFVWITADADLGGLIPRGAVTAAGTVTMTLTSVGGAKDMGATVTYRVFVVPQSKARGSVLVNAGAIADGAGVTTTGTVSGAALGKYVFAAPGIDVQDFIWSAYASAADTVKIRLQNETGTGPTDIGSSVWPVIVCTGPEVFELFK